MALGLIILANLYNYVTTEHHGVQDVCEHVINKTSHILRLILVMFTMKIVVN